MNTTEHVTSCLGEEAAEVASEIVKLTSKCNRFGLDDRNVLDPTGPTNLDRLIDELNDLLGVTQLLVDNGILPPMWQDPAKQEAKKSKVLKFLDYAKGVGALRD